jgi:hypothetical protein
MKPAPDWRPPKPKQKRPEYFEDKKPSFTQQQRELADAVTEFIGRRGGWVTSTPGVTRLRVELPTSIAQQTVDELSKLKFDVKAVGESTHLWWERHVPVTIYEILIK